VTAHAGIWRIVVIPIVAIHTTCDGRVCPVQRIIIVVDRERGRFPTRLCRVAHRTVRRNGQRNVVRIEACVVIRRVTALTSVRRVVIIPVVTCIAVIGNRNMRPCEGVYNVLWSKLDGIHAVSEWQRAQSVGNWAVM
jgi:hypothetical protein